MKADRKRAAPATTERYLWRRGNVWWFRHAVPARYRAQEKRAIICRSTGSSDRHKASVIAAGWRADLHVKWAGGQLGADQAIPPQTSEPTVLDLQIVATEAAFAKVLTKLAELRASKPITSDAQYEQYYLGMQRHLKRLLRTRNGEARRMWERVADNQISRRGWLLPKESEQYELFIGMIAEAGLEAIRLDIRRNGEGVPEEPTSKVVRAGLRAKSEQAPQGQQIADLFEQYAQQRMAEGRKRSDTINQDRKVVQQFAEFVGRTRHVKSIRKEDVRDWRNAVAATPPNFAKSNAFTGMSLREAAAKARGLAILPRSATTVSKYTSTVSPFLAWCVSEGYADTNPCDGLHYKPDKKANRRPSYSDDQLRRIFASPLFTGFEADGKEHKPGSVTANDWRYWIPLICLCTGARIGEITQLHVQDVTQEHDVAVLHIKHEPKAGQQTKSGKSRPVPIHALLKDLGFLTFVERQRRRAAKDGNPRMFPELDANDRDHVGATPSRFWRRYLGRIGMKHGGDGIGAHSFRHTMADRLRAAGYLDNQIAILLGHSQQSVTSGYGSIPQGTVRMLDEMLKAVAFPIAFPSQSSETDNNMR